MYTYDEFIANRSTTVTAAAETLVDEFWAYLDDLNDAMYKSGESETKGHYVFPGTVSSVVADKLRQIANDDLDDFGWALLTFTYAGAYCDFTLGPQLA